MKGILSITAATLMACAVPALPSQAQTAGDTIRTEDLYIRDPFIVTDSSKSLYYLYRSATDNVFGTDDRTVGGVEVFKSTDLENWEGPTRVFTVPEDNWITGRVWAPEVHRYRGKYYLFATLNTGLEWKRTPEGRSKHTFRGTQVFWSRSPEGPFKAFGVEPFTPMDQMCLDGTLWVEDGQPYMVYCREWVEVRDGEMVVRPLKKDLSAPAGAPIRLFCASSAPWVRERGIYVTDGPFIYRTFKGKLLMIWSSFTDEGYAIGIAESTTGRLLGPWRQQENPLFSKNGGHGMIFRSLDGKLFLTLHSPNSGQMERAHFYELEDTGDSLKVK